MLRPFNGVVLGLTVALLSLPSLGDAGQGGAVRAAPGSLAPLQSDVAGGTTTAVPPALARAVHETLRQHTVEGSLPLSSEGLWFEQQQLIATHPSPQDRFGSTVALDGDTALVSDLRWSPAGHYVGSAYVFVRSGTTWTLQQQLHDVAAPPLSALGREVALDGDTALVGAVDAFPPWGQDSVHVFTRSGTTWTFQQKITGPNRVALDGDTALLGAPGEPVGGGGSAFVFTRSGSTWTEQQQLTASDGAAGDSFGDVVALDGDTALVGARYDDVGANVDQGSAYVFTRTGTTWTEQQQLTASDGAGLDRFGTSVALDGNTALASASGDDVGTHTNQGSAYVFTRSGTTWTLQQQLTVSDGGGGISRSVLVWRSTGTPRWWERFERASAQSPRQDPSTPSRVRAPPGPSSNSSPRATQGRLPGSARVWRSTGTTRSWAPNSQGQS